MEKPKKASIKLFFDNKYKDIIDVLIRQLKIHAETEQTNPAPIASNNKFTAYDDFHIEKGVTYDVSLWGKYDDEEGVQYNSANLQIKKSDRQ
tara:strand:+ start:4942 stop:5217 length:276 start_codon:yes stop_codon:yes gene_type:complete